MPGVGIAIGAVVASIKTAIAAGGFLASLIKAAVAIALNVGLSLLQQALNKKKTPGIKADATVGGHEPLSFIVGSWSTPGHLEYVNSWGDSNKTLVQVFTLGDLPVTSISNVIWMNNERIVLDTENEHAEYGYPALDQYAGWLWVKFRDGSDETADSYLLDKFGSDPDRPWTEDMVGVGIPVAIVTTNLNRNLFNGIPRFRFEVEGIKLYDIRKDSTNGGSGSHRWSDPDTWEFSDNFAVIVYNIIRGIQYDGAWFYGGQTIAAERLPPAAWIAAANECDVAIPLADGGTERQFRAGMEIACSNQPLDVIDEFLSGCQGRLSEIGGVYKMHVGAPTGSALFITDDDIVVTDGQTLDPFPSIDQTVNGITATYPEPAEAWEIKEAPPLYNPDLEADDIDRRLVKNVRFECVRYGTQVQRLMKAMLLDARRFRTHVITLPPEAWLLEPGIDYISWTSTRNGYSDKQFLVVGIEGGPGLNQIASLREVDAADYAWSTDDEIETTYSPVGPFAVTPQAMTGWAVEAFDLSGRPSIRVSYTGDELDIYAIELQVRRVSDEEIVFSGTIPYSQDTETAYTNLNGVFAPNTQYESRARFVPLSDRETAWSGWESVTTQNLLIQGSDIADNVIDRANLMTTFLAELDGAKETLNDRISNLQDLVQQLGQLVAAGDETNYRDIEFQKVTYNNNFAQAFQYIDLLTTETEAIATTITGVQASLTALEDDVSDNTTAITGNASAITTLQASVTDINDTLTAQADSITTLESEIDDNTASITTLNSTVVTLSDDLDTLGTTVSAQATSISSLSTTVGDNTADITSIQTSIDGINASWVMAVEVNETAGYIQLQGAKQTDGSTVYDITLAADRITFTGQIENILRNGSFDANGEAVDPVAKDDILFWGMATSRIPYVRVIDDTDGNFPSGWPTPYALELHSSTSNGGRVENDYDTADGARGSYGYTVEAGEMYVFEVTATTDKATDAILFMSMRHMASGGTSTTALTPEEGDDYVNVSPSGITTYRRTYTIPSDGKVFVRLDVSSGASNNHHVFITKARLLVTRDGSVIIPGTLHGNRIIANTVDTEYLVAKAITTETINDYAVVDPTLVDVAGGVDDIAGTSFYDWHVALEESLFIQLPAGYEANLCAIDFFGMTYSSGAKQFDSYIEIWDNAAMVHTGGSYGGSSDQAVSGCTMVPITGTGSFVEYRFRMYWTGEDSTIVLRQRSMLIAVYRR